MRVSVGNVCVTGRKVQTQMGLMFPVCRYISVAVAGKSWLRAEPK